MKNLSIIKIFTRKHYIELIKEKYFKLNKELLKSKESIKEKYFKISKQLLKSNIIIITLFSLTFLYLCYLSIPALYNKKVIELKLQSEIASNFKHNNISFEKFSYTFFPSPHYNIKNVIIKKDKSEYKILEIKSMNVFISQKNFFKKNTFKINSIKIFNSNINLDSMDFIEKIFSDSIKNNITIAKSKIFLNDKNNSTFSIISVNNLKLFFEDKKNHNNLNLHGSVFNLPFKLNYLSNFYNNNNDLKINFGKIKLNFENKSNSKDFYSAKNQIRFLNSIFNTKINNEKNNNIYELISKESKINQTDFNYSGTVNVKPFYFNFNFKVSNVNLLNIIFFNKMFEDILINFFLNNVNLNGKINIDITDIKKNKFFEKGKIVLNIKRGEFDLSGSEFKIKNIGNLKINSNQIFLDDGKVNIQLNTKFVIDDKEKLFKKFLISRKNRLNIKNIYYLMDIYPSSKEIIFSNFEIDEKNNKFYQNTSFTISNWQDLRSMFNELLINYDG